MAVEHTEYPIYGVQFHPESVMTPDGKMMVQNFINVVRAVDKEDTKNDQRGNHKTFQKRRL